MKKNNLILGMSLVTLIAIISLGLIIVSEKGNLILLNQINKELDNYIEENYNDILKDLTITETKFTLDENSYTKTAISEVNEDLSFDITYTKEEEIISTYETNYLKGHSLIKSYEETINKDFDDYSLTINLELDQMSDKTKTSFIKNEDINLLPIFTLNLEIIETTFNAKEISDLLKQTVINKPDYNITKYYLKITTTEEVVEFSNLSEEIINNENLETILLESKEDYKLALDKYNIIVEKGD